VRVLEGMRVADQEQRCFTPRSLPRVAAIVAHGHLVRVLFALERRWQPYHDGLLSQLAILDRQGWPPGYLADTLLSDCTRPAAEEIGAERVIFVA
jgi:hypothetical protein